MKNKICHMTTCILMMLLLLTIPVQAKSRIYPSRYKVPETTKQLVVCRYRKGSKGSLTLYIRNSKGVFKKKLSCTAYFGKKGIGKKKEGDKKTPRGLYTLDQGFGICGNPGTKMPYVKVNASHYWCDDSNSIYYNTLIRKDGGKIYCYTHHCIHPNDYDHTHYDEIHHPSNGECEEDFHDGNHHGESYHALSMSTTDYHNCKGEQLSKYKGSYDYAISIGYNKAQTPKKGSAIFLHCSKKKATAGCIAIPKKSMKKILRYLNPASNPQILIDRW